MIESEKPEGLPDAFWDAETKTINFEKLIEDYNYLAARDENLVETNKRNIPESYEKYEIEIPEELERDDEVLKRFHQCGFSNDQAQLVYNLANERVVPALKDLASNFESKKQQEKLVGYFGSQERFNQVSRQISSWAKKNVRNEVYDALATTAEGVIALYKMMSSNEPMINKEPSAVEELNEASLKKMMQDPRYWRDHDRAYVEKITKGFEQLYPSKIK